MSRATTGRSLPCNRRDRQSVQHSSESIFAFVLPTTFFAGENNICFIVNGGVRIVKYNFALLSRNRIFAIKSYLKNRIKCTFAFHYDGTRLFMVLPLEFHTNCIDKSIFKFFLCDYNDYFNYISTVTRLRATVQLDFNPITCICC